MSDDGLSIFDDAATGDPASTGADDATQVIPAIKDEPANAASKGQERTSTRPPAQSPARPQQSRQQSGPNQSGPNRSEEHTSELQSLMRISYSVFCLKKKNTKIT